MSFAWPLALLSLAAAPALLGGYRWLLRRRRKRAVRYSSVALLRTVLPRRTRWQRHLPIAMLLLSLVALGFATGRPRVERSVPYSRNTIILALDVSGSMCSTDVKPNRLTAAQNAAREFVQKGSSGARMGLVVFSGFAELAVPPTTDRKALAAAIDSLTTGRSTAIGSAMLESLNAIAEIDSQVSPVGDVPEEASPPVAGTPGAHGYVPDIVVLLTDGSNNRGIAPLAAAPYAVARGVRVYTIGFGTTNPQPFNCTRAQLGGEAFAGFGRGPGGGGFGGGGFGRGFGGGFRGRLSADVPTLEAVAARTGATYHGAKNADQLRSVFAKLPKQVATERQRHEITWIFAAIGAALAAAALGASIRWSPYP